MRLKRNTILAGHLLISSALADHASPLDTARSQAWFRRRMPNSIHTEMQESAVSSGCPSANYEACGNDLPGDFCCPAGNTCLSLGSATTSLCCPEGEDCSAIVPVTCNVQQFNVSASPESPVHSLLLEQTPESCGTSSSGGATCCPSGYSCYQGVACVIDHSLPVQSSSLLAPSSTLTGATRDLLWTVTPTTTARVLSRASGSSGQTGAIAGSISGIVVLFVCLGFFIWAVRKGYCCQTRSMQHAAYKRRLAKRETLGWRTHGSDVQHMMSQRSGNSSTSSRPPLPRQPRYGDKTATTLTSQQSLRLKSQKGSLRKKAPVALSTSDKTSSVASSRLSSKALPPTPGRGPPKVAAVAARVKPKVVAIPAPSAAAPVLISATSPYPAAHELETPATTISPSPPSALGPLLVVPQSTFLSPTKAHELSSPPRARALPPPVPAISWHYQHRPPMNSVYATRNLVELPATPPVWRTNFRNTVTNARNWISGGPRTPPTPESGVFGGMGRPI